MTAEIIELDRHENMDALGVLSVVMRENPSEVFVMFVDESGDLNYRWSSGMTHKDLIWNLEIVKGDILGRDPDE